MLFPSGHVGVGVCSDDECEVSVGVGFFEGSECVGCV